LGPAGIDLKNIETELMLLRRALRTTNDNLQVRVPLQSVNYVEGSAGWRFNLGGNAELNNVVVRGTIQANGVFTGTLGADTVNAINISASQITAGFLSVDRLQVNSINGNRIEDNSVGGAKIQNAAITAAKIDNLTITADKIENLTITSDKIGNGQITNAKIDTLDANKITTGFLSANRLQVGSISGNRLSDGSVSSVKIASLDVGKLTGSTIQGFNGNFLTFQATSLTSTISNVVGPGFNVSNSNSFYGNTARVASTLRYDGAPGIVSTTNSLNIFRRNSDNVLVVFTSSRRFKTDIETAPVYSIENVRPVTFRGIEAGDQETQFGLIAEEVAELGVPGLVSYDTDGKPMAVNYGMVGLMLVDHVRNLEKRVKELENNNG
jgi:hypothetical protein